jgi:hypothetical protein
LNTDFDCGDEVEPSSFIPICSNHFIHSGSAPQSVGEAGVIESVLLPDSAGFILLNQSIDSGSALDRKGVENFSEANDKTDLSSSSSVPLLCIPGALEARTCVAFVMLLFEV